MTVEDGQSEPQVIEYPKQSIGMVPIMLRSKYCILSESSDADRMGLKECFYDQGGYFIINGAEKVLVAQEKMSNNHVYVFKKGAGSKYRCASAALSGSSRVEMGKKDMSETSDCRAASLQRYDRAPTRRSSPAARST